MSTAQEDLMTAPTVSVLMITYNHEDFIEQAIDSVLAQKTEFPIELVIGEDCSKDGTADKIRRYTNECRHVIRATFSESNVGMQANFVRTLCRCRGEFVALLEGDDFWTDDQKLQKQYEVLVAHPKIGLCCHNVILWDVTANQRRPHFNIRAGGELSLSEVLAGNCPATCSVMLRRALAQPFPAWAQRLPMGDWPLFGLAILRSQSQKALCLPQTMAVYRSSGTGAWSSLPQHQTWRNWFRVSNAFRRRFPIEWRPAIDTMRWRCCFREARWLRAQGRCREARRLTLLFLRSGIIRLFSGLRIGTIGLRELSSMVLRSSYSLILLLANRSGRAPADLELISDRR